MQNPQETGQNNMHANNRTTACKKSYSIEARVQAGKYWWKKYFRIYDTLADNCVTLMPALLARLQTQNKALLSRLERVESQLSQLDELKQLLTRPAFQLPAF